MHEPRDSCIIVYTSHRDTEEHTMNNNDNARHVFAPWVAQRKALKDAASTTNAVHLGTGARITVIQDAHALTGDEWVDYVFENGRGGTAPIGAIKFDSDEHYCICGHCRDVGTCFGCTSGHCP